jgi:hypothetical protein
MESLSDPERLRDHDDVSFSDETSVHDRETFDYFASVAGMVAVGVTDGDGHVLLMESAHGWRLPYGPVAPGEDWLAVAREIATALTGVPTDVDGVERVVRIDHRLDGDEPADAVTHDLVVGTVPVADEPVADDPTFDPWDDLTVEWFDAVPEDAYWEHDDAVDDVRLFLE